MIILGGSRNDTGKPGISKSCVWDEMSVLDMATIEWQTEYTPATAPYFVPENILKDSTPRGTLISEPMKGWASPGLAKLFDPPQKSGSHSRAVVIGASIGTPVLFIAFVAVGCMFYRRRSAQRKQAPTSNQRSWFPSPLEAAPLAVLSPAPPYSAHHMDKEQASPVEMPARLEIYELPSHTSPIQCEPPIILLLNVPLLLTCVAGGAKKKASAKRLDFPLAPQRGGSSVTLAAPSRNDSPAVGPATLIPPPASRDAEDAQMLDSRKTKLPARLDTLGGVWKWARKKMHRRK